MKKQLFSFLLLLLFVPGIAAQTEKSEKVMEFGDEHCSQILNHVLYAFQEVKKIPDSKLYVIYYQGKHITSSVWNNKLQKYDHKYSNPKRGEALNRAKEVGLVAKDVKFSESEIVLINGGFREKFALALWVVPKDTEPPKPTPTLEEKEMEFREGKPSKPRLCARIYDGL